jgi:hypothetical protein
MTLCYPRAKFQLARDLGFSMATRQELEKKWKPILKWLPEFRAAQTKVLAETGIWVPLVRMAAHCGIETGYTGNPKLPSVGVNSDSGTGCHRDGRCAPDLHAHGLFQIFWPPFGGVDWNKIYDPAYNSYLGAKVLAYRYKECGSWRGASMAFFAGSCVDIGTVDNSTNTSQKEYDQAMSQNMAELEQIGVSSEGNTDPKGPTSNGSTNTKTDESECCVLGKCGKCQCRTIFGKEICTPDIIFPGASLDPNTIAQVFIDEYLPRIILVIIGILLLAIGVWSVLRWP